MCLDLRPADHHQRAPRSGRRRAPPQLVTIVRNDSRAIASICRARVARPNVRRTRGRLRGSRHRSSPRVSSCAARRAHGGSTMGRAGGARSETRPCVRASTPRAMPSHRTRFERSAPCSPIETRVLLDRRPHPRSSLSTVRPNGSISFASSHRPNVAGDEHPGEHHAQEEHAADVARHGPPAERRRIENRNAVATKALGSAMHTYAARYAAGRNGPMNPASAPGTSAASRIPSGTASRISALSDEGRQEAPAQIRGPADGGGVDQRMHPRLHVSRGRLAGHSRGISSPSRLPRKVRPR